MPSWANSLVCVGVLGELGQELKEDKDVISGRDPELSFGSGSREADRALRAQANLPGLPPSQPLSMKMNHILMAAPTRWQDGSRDFTESSGPLRSLLRPAARRLRKPQLSH